MPFKNMTALAAMLISLPSFAAGSFVDNASLEVGGGAKVQMIRVGAQSKWERRWFQSNGTHLSGYWDVSLAQWRGNAYRNVPGQHQNITEIGLAPMFRFQSDDLKGWYVEGGIGAHLLSETYDNDENWLSTAFQFGDQIGAGYVFGKHWEIGMKIQHFSNGGIKRPNSGVNFLVIKASRPF